MKVAFQGIRGAYSEMALHEHFGKAVDTVGCDSFDEVFDMVNSNAVSFGFIPVENTIAGTVGRELRSSLCQRPVRYCRSLSARAAHPAGQERRPPR